MESSGNRNRNTGTTGEAHARRYLEARGYRYVASNWFCRAGELDLVMLDGNELVIIEVKTRRGEAFGHALAAVTREKVRRIMRSAEWFVQTHPQYEDLIWRCDIVGITIDARGVARVEHEINALQWDR
jgi:putative endonuclease